MTHSISRRTVLAGGAATLLTPLAKLEVFALEEGAIELVAKPTQISLAGPEAPNSDLWGYNGGVPGPVLRYRKGDTARIRFRNELPEPTSVHWHGIRIDNAMDGVSGLTQEPVQPGDSFDYDFKLPDAGTYWYHAHNKSWEQVARGLYGALIVDEPEPLFTPEADITLVLDDWRLDNQGRFDAASLGQMMDWSHGGRLGNYLTVNGQTRPRVEVQQGQWTRLRIINAANARIMEIDPNRFGGRVISYDGQPIGEARKLDYAPLLLGPAQRVDLLVKFDKPGDVVLEEVAGRAYPFATLDVRPGSIAPSDAPPIPKSTLPTPNVASAMEFDLLMEGGAMGQMGELIYNGRVQGRMDFMRNKQVWGFNGVANLPEQPFFSVPRGQTVILNVINRTNFAHAMHTHGHHFTILDRDGSTDVEKQWRDTFLIGTEASTRIAFVTDNPGKWLFHCHMLEHAAAGMNTWFEVT